MWSGSSLGSAGNQLPLDKELRNIESSAVEGLRIYSAKSAADRGSSRYALYV